MPPKRTATAEKASVEPTEATRPKRQRKPIHDDTDEPEKPTEKPKPKQKKAAAASKTKTSKSEPEKPSTKSEPEKPSAKSKPVKPSAKSEPEQPPEKPKQKKAAASSKTKSTKKSDDTDTKTTKSSTKSKDVKTKTTDGDKEHNLVISCWNVGGLRSWVGKGGLEYLEQEKPDIFCLQETKCSEDKLPDEIKNLKGYKKYWCASKKDGYAGVGLLTIKEPIEVTYGIEEPDMDEDGRCITAEYDEFYVICVYVPNAGRKLVTLPKRLKWNEAFKTYVNELESRKPVIICGDMNVAHEEIDLARPASNKKNAGFTQEERDGLTDFLAEGYVDTFRELYPEMADAYTFWSYMSNSRAKNIGWRLDYFITSKKIQHKICDNVIQKEIVGSDHCPITLFINTKAEGPKGST